MCFFFSLSVVDGFLAIVHHALVDVESSLNFGNKKILFFVKTYIFFQKTPGIWPLSGAR